MATTATVGSYATAFACAALPKRRTVRATRVSTITRASDKKDEPFDARAFRRELSKSPKYNRSFKKDEESAEAMETAGIGMVSKGGLVAQMRVENFTHVKGDVTLKLADAYGFCWGVERAVQMAYEARKQYPDEQIHITNEIIHNPTVNKRLEDMGVKFIQETPEGKDFSDVKDGEVVILPAFGASVFEMKLLAEKGVSIVDTTCPWVSKVWNAVDSHKRKEFTSIIHGKWAHEETVATTSFAGIYLVVKDLAEAEYVCDYILNGGDKKEFMAKFENAYSKGFDPDVDLEGLGIANQTTMLKGETEQIGKLLEKTMMEKYGVTELNDHYKNAGDTICDATQERQDTSIIHGKWAHEETVATTSFAGIYLVVKDLAEAEYVCDYILNGGDKKEFMAKFENAYSKGFDPDVDLEGLGIANQTTMLKGETEQIGKLLEKTMMEKYGVTELNDHYKNAGDTICDATQERQDAMYKLVEDKPDVMLVIGGFNSSNTQHLQEISEDAGVTSYWVDTPDRVDPNNVITWRTAHGELVTTENWLPEGAVTIGVTSGASTPDKVVEDVIDLIFATKEGMKSAIAA